MDKVWTMLRGQGHLVGDIREQDGHLQVVVDGVVMNYAEARALAEKLTTVQRIAKRHGQGT